MTPAAFGKRNCDVTEIDLESQISNSISPNSARRGPVRRAAIESLEHRRLLTTSLTTAGSEVELPDSVSVVAALADGGRIVAGTFGTTTDFVPAFNQAGDTLTANGETDIFLMRQDANGAILWLKGFGGIGGEFDDEEYFSIVQANTGDFSNFIGPDKAFLGEYVNTVAVGDDGLVYIGGSFIGAVDFDPDAGVVNRFSPDDEYHDAFVAAYDLSDGSLQWVSSFGGPFDDTVRDVAATPDGAVVATGYFTRRADFNPTKQEFLVEALGRDDIFVAKFKQTDTAPIGRLQWVYTAGGEEVDITERDTGESIALDGSGNIYVTGSFAGEADFDPSSGELIVESLEDPTDGFVLRLSPKGKLDYIQSFGGEESDSGTNIAIDAQGRMYLSGYFSDVADLDPGRGGAKFTAFEEGDAFDTDDDSQGEEPIDVFVSQLGLKGELQWARQIGGDDFEYLSSMDVAPDGTIILGGAFAGRISFEPGNSGAEFISVEGDNDDFEEGTNRDNSYDGFAARFDSTGVFLDARIYGGEGDDWVNSAVFKLGDSTMAEVGGSFQATAFFNGRMTGVRGKAIFIDDLFVLTRND